MQVWVPRIRSCHVNCRRHPRRADGPVVVSGRPAAAGDQLGVPMQQGSGRHQPQLSQTDRELLSGLSSSRSSSLSAGRGLCRRGTAASYRSAKISRSLAVPGARVGRAQPAGRRHRHWPRSGWKVGIPRGGQQWSVAEPPAFRLLRRHRFHGQVRCQREERAGCSGEGWPASSTRRDDHLPEVQTGWDTCGPTGEHDADSPGGLRVNRVHDDHREVQQVVEKPPPGGRRSGPPNEVISTRSA